MGVLKVGKVDIHKVIPKVKVLAMVMATNRATIRNICKVTFKFARQDHLLHLEPSPPLPLLPCSSVCVCLPIVRIAKLDICPLQYTHLLVFLSISICIHISIHTH